MENSEVEKKKQSIVRNNTYAKCALWIGVPCVLILPLVLTHCLPGDFKDNGVIGDTIGGTTAPIVGLIGAILVYLSFKQQLIANEIQIDLIRSDKKNESANKEKEFLRDQIKDIKEAIEKLTYNSTFTMRKGEKQYAIWLFFEDLKNLEKQAITGNRFYYYFYGLVREFAILFEDIKSCKYLNEEEKKHFVQRVSYLYYREIYYPTHLVNDIKSLDDHFDLDSRISLLIEKIETQLESRDLQVEDSGELI